MESTVFFLRGLEYQQKTTPGRTRDIFALVITDTPYDDNFIKQAWDYAIKETSEKMQPVYDRAIEWLRSQHPEWQVIPCGGFAYADFDMGRSWASPVYPPQ